MKNAILAALVTFGVSSLDPPSADAGLLHHWRCKGFSTYVCVRPYNAFSPVCHGSIHATGCCPLTMSMPNCCPMPSMPSCFTAPMLGPPAGCDIGCYGGSCGTPVPMHHGPMPHHNLMPQGPIQTAPMPTPINPSMYRYPTTMVPYGYGMVRPVAYQQGFYGYPQYQLPGYNPSLPAPCYWYGQ